MKKQNVLQDKLFSKTFAGFCFLLVGLVSVLMIAGVEEKPACAAAAASACDPDYYDVLESRAWLEAQREITQNQNVISKPDSVLRYSCYVKRLVDLQKVTFDTPFFSEKTSVPGIGFLKATSQNYVNDNFKAAHEYTLGGRSEDKSGTKSELTAPDPCDVMNKVWKDAKCMGFIDQADTDGFFTLEEYAGSADKRFQGNCPANGSWGSELTASQGAAKDGVDTYASAIGGGGLGSPAGPYGQPGNCPSSQHRATGATVTTGVGSNTPERTCLMPGCHYNYSSNMCQG